MYARRFDASGLFVANEFSVNTTTSLDQGNAVVDMNAYGEFVVAWSGNGTGDSDGIFYRRYAANGTALDATEVRANGSNLGAEISPAVALNDSGLFSIAWNVGDDLFQRNFAADGTPTTVDFQVDNGLANASGAAIGIDAQGRTVTVYRTDGLSGLGAGIWLRAFNANGSQWRTWQMVASSDATAPSIAMDDAGNFNIAYEGSGDGDGKTVFVRRYSSSFTTLEAVQQVNITTSGNQQMASIAMLDQSNYTVVWSGEQGPGDTDGVFARQFGFLNVAPVITSNGGGATAAISVAENSTAVTTVTATDSNVPTQTLSYLIAGGADASKFTINTTSGVLAFAASPNFELRADANADNIYDVIVSASDGLLSTNQAISVTVTNVHETPIAQADTFSAVQSTPLTVTPGTGLLANDSDPDNQMLSVVSVGTPAHGTVSLTPAALTAITNLTNNAAADTRADWSPDGSKIAFDTGRDGNNEIYVMNADGSGLVRLTNNTGDDSQAAWSPDGTKIAFMSNRSGTYEVWVMNASDGTGLTRLTTTSSSVSGQPAWSPDGSRIAFTSNRNGNYEIYSMNADGTGVIRLTTATGDDSEPAWSPDGTKIAFASTRDGNSEIYVMNADGTGQTRLTNNAAVDRSPTWSPNGSKIAFISARSGVQQVYIMDANGGNPTAVTAQTTNVAFPDWSSDGSSLLFTLNDEVQRATVVFDGGFVYTPTAGYLGSDSFTYTVSDLNGLTTTATATITVSAPPVITSNGGGATAAISVAENVTSVTAVTATDADLPAQTLTYSISGGVDAARFLINNSNGILTFASTPNFESPTDSGSDNVYDVIVQVSDGTLTDSQAIAVTVTAVNDNTPTITSNGGGATASISVVENTTDVTTVTATDADLPGPTLTYNISGGADASKFTIDSLTGVLRFVAAPNFEAANDMGANNVYDVIVRVSDGSLTDTQSISVTVTNSTTGDSLIATQDTYVNSSQKSTNYGQSTSLIVDKSGSGIGNSRALLLFDLADIPVNSTITSAVLVMRATQISSATDVNVYQVTQAWSEGSGNATAGQANWDDRQSGVGWTSKGGDFASTIVATLNTAAIGQHTWDITSLVADWKAGVKANHGVILGSPNSGSGTVTYSSAEGAFAPQLLVTFDISNAPPVITSNGGATSAALNVIENSTTVTTVTATDANLPGQTLTYSISGGADASKFAINGSTGELTFVVAPNFESPTDSGSNNSYDVIVRVSDGVTADTQALSVTVTNINEAPVLTVGPVSLGSISANQTSAAMTVASFATAGISDPDAAALSGIAVTASAGAGTWQYSTNGVTWNSMGTVSSTQALLLRSTDSVRFVGSGTATGAASLTYAAWDQTGTTSGQQGNKVSLSTFGTGGSAPFSSNTNTATLSLLAVNQPPVATNDNYSLNEGSTLTTAPGSGWLSPDWNTRQRISFNNATGTALTDHVALVTLNTSNFDYSKAQSAGQDLRFVDGDGTVLHYEIEEWNSTGTSQVWVRVPQINAASNTDFIWMYSGNSQAADAQSASSVWAGQQAVLHMNSAATDSSPNSISVTSAGTTAASGITSGAQAYDGLSSTVQLASNPNLNNLFSGGGTLSAWINPTGWGEAGYGRIADKASSVFASGATGNGWGFEVTSAGRLLFQQGFTATTGEWVTAAGTISLNNWQHVAVVYDSSSLSNTPTIYINGVSMPVTRNVAPAGTALTDAGQLLTVGNFALATSRTFDGRIDEFRAVDSAQSAASILAQYKSVAGTLVTIGASEAGPGGVLNNDSDPEGSPLTVSLVSGPAHAASFTLNADGSFQYTHDGSETTADSFTYRLSDGSATRTATVNLTIAPVNDRTPVITSGGGGATATVTAAENVSLVMTVTATDADLPSQTLVYSITGGTDATKFSLDSSTGVLSFVNAPDFEVPTDSNLDNSYEIVVRVSDGTFFDTQTLTVVVPPANDNTPVITSGGGNSSISISVAENTAAVTTITATDADLPSQMLTYSITDGADRARFVIDSVTGVLSFATAPDYDAPVDVGANNVYRVTVQVTDGTLVDTQELEVSVTSVNDNMPIITSNGGAATAAINVAENTTAVTTLVATDADLPSPSLVYSIAGGVDATKFTINSSTGELRFLTAPNFEAPSDIGTNNVYDVVVQVTDGTFVDTQAIAVTVTPVNESNPLITSNGGGTSAAISVSENSTAVTTVTATDADLPSPTLVYSISGGNDATRFAINSSTGELRFVSAPNFEVPVDSNLNNIYSVNVRVSDGSRVDSQNIFVTVTNVNEAPVITSNGGGAVANFNIAENTTLVTTVSSTDVDGADAVYSIVSGADAALFAIDSVTGVLQFVNSQNFDIPNDANGDNVFSVGIQVSDGNGATDFQLVNVQLTNVNETPVGTPITPVSVLEDAPAGTVSVSPFYVDPDHGALTFSISQVNEPTPLFRSLTIDAATGIISYALRSNANGTAVISVRAVDAGGLFIVQQLSLNVQAVNDAPQAVRFNGSTLTGQAISISSPGLLQNASDIEGDLLRAVLIQAPANGSVVVQPNGSFVYTPNSGYIGNDTFLFAVSDGQLSSANQTATIAVLPPVVTVSTGSGTSSGSSGSSASTATTTSGNSGSGSGSSGSGSGFSGGTGNSTNTNSGATNSAGTGANSNTAPPTTVVPASAPVISEGTTNLKDEDIGLIMTSAPVTNADTRIRNLVPAPAPVASNSTETNDRIQTRRTLIGAIGFSDRADTSDSASQAAARELHLQREIVYQTLIQHNLENVAGFEEKISERFSISDQVVGSVGVVTTSFSVGYLIWAVRFGTLLSGLLTQIPTWSMLDPLLVIDGETKDEDKESLQSIMDRQQAQLKTHVPPQPLPELPAKAISDHADSGHALG